MPQRFVAGPVADELGEDLAPERLEGGRVTEETRHADQEVLEQCLHFRRVLLEEAQVLPQPFRLLEDHAAPDTAVEGIGLVVAEIDPGGVVEELDHPREIRLTTRLLRPGHGRCVRVATDADDLVGDLARGQDEIHAAGGDGAVRHTVVLGRRVLGERDAALGLDRFQPHRAVRGGAGQDHADGLMPLFLRQ